MTSRCVLLLSCLLLTAMGQCPKGRFGQECQHFCHCALQASCDVTTGACKGSNSGNTCAHGYFGPICQGRNAARGATVTVGDMSFPVNAINRRENCPLRLAGMDRPYVVKLRDDESIDRVDLHLAHLPRRGSGTSAPVVVKVSVGGEPCKTDAMASPDRFDVTVVRAHCGGRRDDAVTMVMASANGLARLCRFAVPVCNEGFIGELCEKSCDSCEQGSGCQASGEDCLGACERCWDDEGRDGCAGICGEGASKDQGSSEPDGAKTSGRVHWPSAGVGAGVCLAVLAAVLLVAAGVFWCRRRCKIKTASLQIHDPVPVDDGYEVPQCVLRYDNQSSYASLNPNTRELSVNVYQEMGPGNCS